jgi:hypothetical protein
MSWRVLVSDIEETDKQIGNHISVLLAGKRGSSASLLKLAQHLSKKAEELINREKLEVAINDFIDNYNTVFNKDELWLFKKLCLERCVFHKIVTLYYRERYLTWSTHQDRTIILKDIHTTRPWIQIRTIRFDKNLTSVTNAWTDKTNPHHWNSVLYDERKQYEFGFSWVCNDAISSTDVESARAFFKVPTIISSKLFFFGIYHLYSKLLRDWPPLQINFDCFDTALDTFNSYMHCIFPFHIRHYILDFLSCYLSSAPPIEPHE